MQHYEICPNRFLVWWLVGSVLVYPLAVIVGAIAVFVMGAAMSLLTNMTGVPTYRLTGAPLPALIYSGLTVATLGACIGFSVGHIQRHLLRRYLFWTAESWRRLSTMGGACGSLSVAGVYLLLSIIVRNPDVMALALMPVFILVVSLFQWRTLRHATRSAGLWVLANVTGGLVFSGLIIMNQPEFYSRSYNLSMLLLAGLAVLSQGFITGFMMLWLFEKFAYPPVDEDGDGKPDRDRKPSVWDDAI